MKPGNRILLRSTTRHARRLWTGTALIGLHQVCEAFVPILIGVIVDRAVAPGDLGALVWWVGVLAALFVLLTTAYRHGARRLMQAIATEGHLLRLDVVAKVLHPRGIRTELRAGDLLTVSTSDADNASYVLDYVPRIVGSLVAATVAAVALMVISVPLGLVVLIATPVVLAGLQLAAPRITRRVTEQQERAGEASSLATDLVTGLRPLRGIGAQEAAAARYREVSRRSLTAMVRAARTQGGYLAASTAVASLLAGGVAILAGWFALTGRISVGEFITVIGLAQFLIEPLETLAVVPGWMAEARASADRIALVEHAPHRHPEAGVQAPPRPCDLRLDQVHSGPLAGLDLRVGAGEFVGVVTPRAGDAEALTAVLAGVGDYRGSVTLGGSPLADLADARRLMLVEPHHTDLFTGTIRVNVALESGDDLAGALRAAAAYEVLDQDPAGLDRPIAERGASLSGGQRQRLALARALFARPPILVLHEPTTAVDAVTEHAIAGGIRAFRDGLATVVITSSPALLAVADRVVVLGDGRVTAEGRHDELGATREDYRTAVLR
jgi:putative ABC transport system ATP-binding protein